MIMGEVAMKRLLMQKLIKGRGSMDSFNACFNPCSEYGFADIIVVEHQHPGEVKCVALSNGMVASCSRASSGEDTGGVIINQNSTTKTVSKYRGNYAFGSVNCLCFLPNDSGGLVACGGNWYDLNGNPTEEDVVPGFLNVYSPSLELVQTLGHDGYGVYRVTVSPTGYIVSLGRDMKVIIWSESGEGDEWARVQVLEDHTELAKSVCFSPDGKQLATGSRDGSINLYSFNEGSAILAHTLEGHTRCVNSLSFSPDCKLLCSGSLDYSIKFWNPADGSLVKSIDGAHTFYVWSVSYSPNGRVLVSAGYDKTMKIWDAETFELKQIFEPRGFYTMQLTITADSNFIVSANSDNTVRFTLCREYTFLPSCLTPILNLLLHIVYKWEFVSFLEPNENTSILEKVMRLLGECVHDGGYNVTSEILSFLSPAHLPVQITPTRWKSDPESLKLFMRARYERQQEENEAAKEQEKKIDLLERRIAELEFEQEFGGED